MSKEHIFNPEFDKHLYEMIVAYQMRSFQEYEAGNLDVACQLDQKAETARKIRSDYFNMHKR